MKKEILLPLAAFIALALIWGLEILYFQASSIEGYDLSSLSGWQTLGVKRTTLVCLTFVAVGFCLLAFPSWLIRLLFVGNIGFFLVVAEYRKHFGRPLMLQSILYQSGDLLRVLDFSTGWIPFEIVIPLLAVFAVKWVLSASSGSFRYSLGKSASIGAMGAFVLYGSVLAYDGQRQKFTRNNFGVLKRRLPFENVARHYGYLPAWLADALIVNPTAALQNANAKRNLPARRLLSAPSQFELPPHIAAIQMESIDFDLLGFRYRGQEVLPFLNKMVDDAVLFKILPIHQNGSADADFIFLNRIEPNDWTVNYRLLAFEYKDTTTELFRAKGYQTVFLHNFRGDMYHRGEAFKRLHFDRLYFLEELSPLLNVPIVHQAIPDEHMFGFSNQLFVEADRPMFHFMITFSTHKPFYRYPKTNSLLVESPSTPIEHYMNAASYLDAVLSDYVASLPENSLILLYSDHESKLKFDYIGTEWDRESERVPAILYRKGGDLTELRSGLDEDLRLSGELDMLDISRFFYELIENGQLGETGQASTN